MTTATQIIMRAIPYEGMSTPYLIAEMLRLQRYCEHLRIEALDLTQYCEQVRNLEYWLDLVNELHLVAVDAKLCEDILNLRWRGYV